MSGRPRSALLPSSRPRSPGDVSASPSHLGSHHRAEHRHGGDKDNEGHDADGPFGDDRGDDREGGDGHQWNDGGGIAVGPAGHRASPLRAVAFGQGKIRSTSLPVNGGPRVVAVTDHPAPLAALLDGTLLAANEPLLRPDDLGVLRGEGVFETTLVVDGCLLYTSP